MIKESTLDWLCDQVKDLTKENKELQDELENLRQAISDVILDPVTLDADGNHLTGSQIKDQQLKAIADLVFPTNIKPFMGLFWNTADDLADLKIGFKS